MADRRSGKRRRERDSGVGDSPEQAQRPQPQPPLEPLLEREEHRATPQYRSDTSDSDGSQVGLPQPRVQARPAGPLADPDLELAPAVADLAVVADPEVVDIPEPIEIDNYTVMDADQFNQFLTQFGTRMDNVVAAIPGAGGPGAAGPAGANGGQIQSVVTFSGDDGKDPKIWLSGIEMLATAYKWNDATIAQVAKSRCTDTANRWVNSQKILGLNMDYYETHATDAAGNPARKGFKAQFLARFKTTIQSVAATEALQNLTLKNNEDVRTFFDRIVFSVDLKNYSWTEQQKTTAEYIAGRNADIMAFFSAGLPEEMRTLCQAGVPPSTANEWLERAVRLQAAKKDKHHGVHVVDGATGGVSGNDVTQTGGASTKNQSDRKDPIEELRKEVAALRAFRGKGGNRQGRGRGDRGGGRGGRGGGRGACFGCNDQGHQVLGCPKLSLEERIKKAEAFLARQKNRGGGRGGRGTQGRGGDKGGNRDAYTIESTEDEYEAYQGN